MPADFVIDENHRVVFSAATGVFTCADCTSHMDRLTADARFRPDFNQVIDYTGITSFQVTPEHVQHLAKREIFSVKSRRAFVVASDYQFGLGRMFASLRENEGEPGIIIFRELPAALVWANVPAEVARQAFASNSNPPDPRPGRSP